MQNALVVITGQRNLIKGCLPLRTLLIFDATKLKKKKNLRAIPGS